MEPLDSKISWGEFFYRTSTKNIYIDNSVHVLTTSFLNHFFKSITIFLKKYFFVLTQYT